MRRRLDWSAELAGELAAYAASRHPHEACGVISRGWRSQRFWPAENAASEPSTSFAIDPDEQRELLERISARSEEIVALFHSHPNSGPEPSLRDRAMAENWPGLIWVIAGLRQLPDGGIVPAWFAGVLYRP